jgi:hypothetical protein
MVTPPILVFPDWTKEFNVHVGDLSIALGAVLAQSGVGGINHPISFARKKLSMAERNYTTTKREGLAMVYALQKFRHYLLRGHFKMFTHHSALKYLVNKTVLGEIICDVGASLASMQRQDQSTHESSSRTSTLAVAANFEILLNSTSKFTFGGMLEPVSNFTL